MHRVGSGRILQEASPQRRWLSISALKLSRRRGRGTGEGHASASAASAGSTRGGEEGAGVGFDFSNVKVPKSYDGNYRVGAEIPIVTGEVGRLGDYLRYKPGGLKNMANRGSSLVQAAFGHEQYSRTVDTPALDHGVDVLNREMAAVVEEEYLAASQMADTGTWKVFLDEGRKPDQIAAHTNSSHAAPNDDDEGIDVSSLMMDAMDDVAEEVSEASRRRTAAYQAVEVDTDSIKAGAASGRVLPSPFGEQVIPSNATAYSFRGGNVTIGEHTYWYGKQLTAPTFNSPSARALASREVETLLLDLTQRGSPLLLPNSADARREEVQRLLGRVFEEDLFLQAETVESVFRLFSAVSPDDWRLAAEAAAQHNASPIIGRLGSSGVPTRYSPDDFLINRYVGQMSKLYYHLKRNFTAPTPIIVELMMKAIHRNTVSKGALLQEGDREGMSHKLVGTSGTQKRLWWYNQAHLLLRDCDKFVTLPTRGTYTAYFGLCAHYGDMPTVIRRFIDSQEAMGIVPNPAMLTSVIGGLVRNGHNEEALRLIARCSSVRMTTGLLNVMLEALLFSRDPMACFAAYDAICLGGDTATASGALQGRGFTTYGITPNPQTYSLLLLAMQKSGEWSGTSALLGQMQRAGIKGDATTLNLMLKGLLKSDLTAYANQLHRTMIRKHVPVWPDLAAALPTVSRAPTTADTTTAPTVVVDRDEAEINDENVIDLTAKFAQFMGPVDGEAEALPAAAVTANESPSAASPGLGELSEEDDDARFNVDPWDIDDCGEMDALNVLDDRKLAQTKGSPEDSGLYGEPEALPHADYFNYEAGVTSGIHTPTPTPKAPALTFKGKNGLKGAADGLPSNNDRRYTRATTEERLRELFGSNRGHTVHPRDLLKFLRAKGIPVSDHQASSPAALVRKASKLIIGV